MQELPPTVFDIICAVAPALGDGLASSSALAAMQAAGGQLPLADGVFECHLGSPDRVDMAVRLQQGSGALCLAEAEMTKSAWPHGNVLHRRINAWLQKEQQPEVPLSLWLEYDQPGETLPSPSLFLGPGLGAYTAAPKLAQWTHDLDGLTGGDYERSVSTLISHCEEVLPDGAWAGYVGRMAESRGDVWRLVLCGMMPDCLAAYLRAVSWPGSADVMDAAVTAAGTAGGPFSLALDMLPGERPLPGSSIGLEVAIPAEAAIARAQYERLAGPAFDPDVLAGLLRWPGVTCHGDPHWSEALRTAVSGVVRRLNHLKLVYRDSTQPVCKAYLYFGLIGHDAFLSWQRRP